MSAHRQERRRARLALVRTFIVTFALGALITAGVPAAHGTTAYGIGETNPQNETVHHDRARVNSHTGNRVSWRPYYGSCGQEMVLGLRSPSGTQFARSEVGWPRTTWHRLTRSNGSSVLPKGTFYLNSRMTHFDATGAYTGPCTWLADLTWNVAVSTSPT